MSELATELRQRADRLGRTDLSQRINTEAARWPEGTCTIAVIGGRGVGKSRLIAGLTGRPELAPHRPTPVPVIIRSGAGDRTAVCDVDGHLHQHDRLHLAVEPHRTEYLDVVVDAPRLVDGVVLVDTPGFGAATDARANRTFLATRRADHLMVVVDLGTPLSRPELELIVRCADRFAAIAVVGTRIDRIRGWRQVLDDSVTAISQELPHLDVVSFGVSVSLAEAAFDPGIDDDEATELLVDSGISRLQAHLDTIATRRRHLRLANFASLLDSIAIELTNEGRLVVEATTAGTADDVDQLASLRHELARVRDDRSTWLAVLSDAVNAARDETAADVTKSLATLQASYRTRIDDWKGDTDELLREFDVDLATEAAACAARIADRLEQVVQIVSHTSEATDLGLHVDAQLVAEQLVAIDPPDVRSEAAASGGLRMRATGGLIGMATSTTMMLTALSGPGGAAALMRMGAFGAAALFSGVSAAVTVTGTRRQRDQQQLHAAVKSHLDAIRSEQHGVLRRYFLGVQRTIESTLKDIVRDRIAVLEREIAALQTTARADALERRRRASTLEEELSEVAELQRRSRDLAAQVTRRGSDL